MKGISCEMARDLMALCAGGVACSDTQKALEKHMSECAECRDEYARLRREVEEPAYAVSQAEDRRVIVDFKRRQRRKRLVIALIASFVTAALIFACGMAYMHVSAVTDFFRPVFVVSARDLTEDGGWYRLKFKGGALELDGIFNEMEVTSYVDNPGPAELRFLNEDGSIALEGVRIQPNESVKLDGLKRGKRYQAEVLAEGKYFIFNFH